MSKKAKHKISGFNYPTADNIQGRTSTICRSMACTLLKREACTIEKEEEWKKFFPNKTCAYCGKPANHLDHLFPLIVDRKPTGYGTEPGNLVPCCRECNQPKGNLHWEVYMRSDNCNHIGDATTSNPQIAKEKRILNIKEFQTLMPAEKIIIDDLTLQKWNEILHMFDDSLKKAQEELVALRKELYKK